MSDFSTAMTNRSLRTIKTELEFLLDANVITSQQFDTITSQLPLNAAAVARTPIPTPSPQPPVQQMANVAIKKDSEPEKKVGYYAQDTVANPPPPAYPVAPTAPIAPPVLAHATAMYQYNAQDAGDLALMPNDRITVTEYMNNEWWKGRNERTGQEGIFPASYVRKEERAPVPIPPHAPAPSNYGNMPLDVSNGAASDSTGKAPSKMEENGKKFGKKLGNAAIFGAGATIGGKIVNGIF
ncbi:SH3-domain-containing protein [Westerdykella ornata]|uniref:SH3-domain-containing protein n=1 Tax=Westerdykella ornata TaxID=318751 RepID=A0A6A6JCS3_WESOR|nr:SH3-domain-containing protein [Westerdykella ornata]KAF2274024.1 SH3-domain-containing protein [Westerdykella ornata]